jgi:hypothetical protein
VLCAGLSLSASLPASITSAATAVVWIVARIVYLPIYLVGIPVVRVGPAESHHRPVRHLDSAETMLGAQVSEAARRTTHHRRHRP